MSSHPFTSEQLEAFRQEGDPLADRAIARLVAKKGHHQAMAVFHLLIRNIRLPREELPPELNDYFEATQSLPPGTDIADIEQAHRFFLDHGPKLLILLYYQSLPILYACAKGAEVLVRTGRLARTEDQFGLFTRRIAETGQFLIDVMTPGELVPGGMGVEAVQKVRLIHASIRHFLQQEGWDQQEWGVPINQEDMAITLQTFSSIPLRGLQRMGMEIAASDAAAYYRCWRGIGSLMGVREALIPATAEEGLELAEQILSRQRAVSESGQSLTRALLRFAEATIPRQRFDDAPEALIRYFLDPATTKALGVEIPRGCASALTPEIIARLFQWGEKMEDRSVPMAKLAERLSQKMAFGMVNYFNEYKQSRFRIPAIMLQQWDLDQQ